MAPYPYETPVLRFEIVTILALFPLIANIFACFIYKMEYNCDL